MVKREDFYNQIPFTHKVVLLAGNLHQKYDNITINVIKKVYLENKPDDILQAIKDGIANMGDNPIVFLIQMKKGLLLQN